MPEVKILEILGKDIRIEVGVTIFVLFGKDIDIVGRSQDVSKKSIECLENHPAQNPQIAVEMKTCSLFTNNVIDRELVSYMVWQVTEMALVFSFLTSS